MVSNDFFMGNFVNWEGEPITRTPYTHSYSYETFVTLQKKKKYKDCIYSDRLLQWDRNKHGRLCQKYFGNTAHTWSNRDSFKIEKFLQDYTDNKDLKLVGIMQGCNQSSGYPFWVFMYD